MASQSFKDQCKGLQKGVILEKCRVLLSDPDQGPLSPAWRWAAEFVSKYGEPQTPTGITVTTPEPLGARGVPLATRLEQARKIVGTPLKS